jgi:hypothetical protein
MRQRAFISLLSGAAVAEPFWEIVTDAKWATVDQEMKEAFDRLDHGRHGGADYFLGKIPVEP